MLLPPEVIEKIFSFLDYKTLRSAMWVNKQWQEIIFHQAKQRCLREMSRCALADYEHRLWGKCETGWEWAKLYDNWQSWRNISVEVDFQIDPTTCTFSDEDLVHSCILGDYFAVGTRENIFIYNMDNCIKEFSVDFLIELYFITDEDSFPEPTGLVAICIENTTIFDLQKNFEPLIIDELDELSLYKVSVHNSRISYLTPIRHLRILRIRRDNTDSLTYETEYVLQMEKYDPNNYVIAISLTETSCCVLYYGRFYTVYLDNDHVTKVVENVSFSDLGTWKREPKIWMLPNNFLITSHYCELQGVMTSFMESHYLDDCNKDHTLCRKRLELGLVMESHVSAAAMHGSTLIFGCEDGSLIFYNVDDWRSFNVMNFSHLIRMPYDLRDKVNNIEVYGRGTERVYTVLREKSVIRVVASMRYIF